MSNRRNARLAQVGWTGSNQDRVRLETVRDWMMEKYGEKTPAAWPGIKFDLTYQGEPNDLYGSDFLQDERVFDTVILHYIFGGWDPGEKERLSYVSDHFVFGLSDLHSPDAWKRRLIATCAKQIFVFGYVNEVAAEYLGDITGYEKTITPFGCIYKRLSKSN